MPRPIKGRKVCCLPQSERFGPLGRKGALPEEIVMTVDEYETIRLIDYLDFTQEECAKQMNVAITVITGDALKVACHQRRGVQTVRRLGRFVRPRLLPPSWASFPTAGRRTD